MKKILAMVVVIVTAMICFCGCAVGFVNSSVVRYDNADKYTAGDREITDSIDTLDLDWVTGSVKVTSGGSTVRITETTKGELDDKYKVHTWAEGSTLHVRYCKSGERYEGKEEKTLEITIPEGTVFDSIRADTASADISFEGVSTKKAAMDASSGDMSYKGNADSFSAVTSSGNISFSGRALEIKADCSSGDVFIENMVKAKSIDVNTSSGEVNLYLTKDSGFTANISTSSGNISFDMPLTKSGEDSYVYGNGECKIGIDTSSGDIEIKSLG